MTHSGSILISTDLDDCLIAWDHRQRNGPFDAPALLRATEALHRTRDVAMLHWNTGRNLASLRNLVEPAVGAVSLLNRMRVDFLSANNGQTLYINREHAETGQWIQNLREADTDPHWTLEIETRTGWRLPDVVKVRAEVLASLGFSGKTGEEAHRLRLPTYRDLRVYAKPVSDGAPGEIPGNVLLCVQCFDTQPGFRLSEWRADTGHRDTARVVQAGLSIQRVLQQALQTQFGTETTLSHKPMNAGDAYFEAFTLFPDGIHKGGVIPLILSAYMRDPQAVITVGDDDYNDLDLLQPDFFAVSPSRCVPNYPVVVGDNETILRAVTRNPRYEQVPVGCWDEGVTRQMRKLEERAFHERNDDFREIPPSTGRRWPRQDLGFSPEGVPRFKIKCSKPLFQQ